MGKGAKIVVVRIQNIMMLRQLFLFYVIILGVQASVRVDASWYNRRGPPSVPRDVRASPSTQNGISACVSWNPPKNFNGAAPYQYNIRAIPQGNDPVLLNTGDGPIQSVSTTFCLRNLRDGQRYFIEVQAVNSYGAGSFSSCSRGAPCDITVNSFIPSACTICDGQGPSPPQNQPTPPTNLITPVFYGPKYGRPYEIWLEWDPPVSSGNSAINYYTIFIYPPPSTYGLSTSNTQYAYPPATRKVFQTATSYTVQCQRKYQFSMTATNHQGYTSIDSGKTAPIVIDYCQGDQPVLLSDPYSSFGSGIPDEGSRRRRMQEMVDTPPPTFSRVANLGVTPETFFSFLNINVDILQATNRNDSLGNAAASEVLFEFQTIESDFDFFSSSNETGTNETISILPFPDLNITVVEPCACSFEYIPVCGTDGTTYSSVSCAICAGQDEELLLEGQCEDYVENYDTYNCACPSIYDPVCAVDWNINSDDSDDPDGDGVIGATTHANAGCALCAGHRPDLLLNGTCLDNVLESEILSLASSP